MENEISNEKGAALKDSREMEKSQAQSGSEVREGQENSSILHDEKDKNKELGTEVTERDIKSVNQQEYIDDDAQNINDEKK